MDSCVEEWDILWMDIYFLFFSLMCVLGRHRESYHLHGNVRASQCIYYVPYMQLLSVDFSFKAVCLLTVHQVLISGARDEPSSDHIRHGEAITARPCLVMVCTPNDKPTGRVLVLTAFVCLPPQWNFSELHR